VEGYFCEFRKTWGVFRKTFGLAGFDRLSRFLTDLDPLDLDPRATVACGRRDSSYALDLDLTATHGCKQQRRRNEAATAGDDARWQAAALHTRLS
jgi:hypothetical protein